jgi:hypothetical protein
VSQKVDDYEDKFVKNFQEVSKAIERSQTLMEGKLEYVVAQQGQQQRELLQTDMRRLVQQFTEQVNQRADASQDGSTNSIQRIQKRLDDVVLKLQELQTSVQAADVLTQKAASESKNTQSKIDTLYDSQGKRNVDLEESVCRKVQKLLNDGLESFRLAAAEEFQVSTDKLNQSIKANGLAYSKCEQSMIQMTRDFKEECTREISSGIGAIGNSLSLQLENVKTAQNTQHLEAEKGMKGLMENMIQQSQYDADRMKRMETSIMEFCDRTSKSQLDGLRDIQRRFESGLQDQQEIARKSNVNIQKVLDQGHDTNSRCNDNGERLAALSELLGVCRDRSSPGSRTASAGRRDRKDRDGNRNRDHH